MYPDNAHESQVSASESVSMAFGSYIREVVHFFFRQSTFLDCSDNTVVTPVRVSVSVTVEVL